MADTLEAAAVRLRNASPTQFEDFVNVFRQYTTEVTFAVTDAGAEEIMTFKGRAQQCRSLLRLFEETPARAAHAARAPRSPP